MDVESTECPKQLAVKRSAVESSKLIHGSEDGHGSQRRILQSSRGFEMAIVESMPGK
jgi:hypothetical protein